ncbi:hypothetical protein JRO89_XS14G0105200 [Xanthoceras sorbifolium]|uniref:Retrovirus-related Pol polyprotein from transposon TNT 1-94 n=1 Tax=Xanthoceras sorbifolium TaxID=99658 RepID=A0ABQ8H4V7_9ROSI|nr:hypothetical protein JRO89_XS14G0105200 [Xanthoceras sorbifolium]
MEKSAVAAIFLFSYFVTLSLQQQFVMATENNSNFVQPSILRFSGHYDHWSMLMENFLRSKEYWQVIESSVTEPAEGTILTDAQRKELDELKLKDLKAKNYLFQAIDRSILETILQKDTFKQIWDSMKKKYQGPARAKSQQLQFKGGIVNGCFIALHDSSSPSSSQSSSSRGSSSSSSSSQTLRPLLPRPSGFGFSFSGSAAPFAQHHHHHHHHSVTTAASVDAYGGVFQNLVGVGSSMLCSNNIVPYQQQQQEVQAMQNFDYHHHQHQLLSDGLNPINGGDCPTGTITTSSYTPTNPNIHNHQMYFCDDHINSLAGSVGSTLSITTQPVVAPPCPAPNMTVGPGSPSVWPLTNDEEYIPHCLWDYGDPFFNDF